MGLGTEWDSHGERAHPHCGNYTAICEWKFHPTIWKRWLETPAVFTGRGRSSSASSPGTGSKGLSLILVYTLHPLHTQQHPPGLMYHLTSQKAMILHDLPGNLHSSVHKCMYMCTHTHIYFLLTPLHTPHKQTQPTPHQSYTVDPWFSQVYGSKETVIEDKPHMLRTEFTTVLLDSFSHSTTQLLLKPCYLSTNLVFILSLKLSTLTFVWLWGHHFLSEG
jgi:hypothetical protein